MSVRVVAHLLPPSLDVEATIAVMGAVGALPLDVGSVDSAATA
jgi:hypothetical protein